MRPGCRDPFVAWQDADRGIAVVSQPCGVADLLGRHPSEIDGIISSDGLSGRIPELIRRGQPVVMLTHWQSLFDDGSAAGLRDLDEVLKRVGRHYGGRFIWTRCKRDCPHRAGKRVELIRRRRSRSSNESARRSRMNAVPAGCPAYQRLGPPPPPPPGPGPRSRRPPPPPPPPRSPRALRASSTVRYRPSSSAPFIPRTAAAASSSEPISTNPKPRELPE